MPLTSDQEKSEEIEAGHQNKFSRRFETILLIIAFIIMCIVATFFVEQIWRIANYGG